MIHLNYKEKALVDSETGDMVRPSCFDVLAVYVSYLEGKRRHPQAQEELQKVFEGEKVISEMIEETQRLHLIRT